MRRGFYVFDYSLYIDGAYRTLLGERWNVDFFTTWGPAPNAIQAASFRAFGIVPGLFVCLFVLGAAVQLAYWLGPARGIDSSRVRIATGLVVAVADWLPISFPWVDLFALAPAVVAIVVAAEPSRRSVSARDVGCGLALSLAIASKPNLGVAALACAVTVSVVGRRPRAALVLTLVAVAAAAGVVALAGDARRWLEMLTLPGSDLPRRVLRLVNPAPMLFARPGLPSLSALAVALVAVRSVVEGGLAWVRAQRSSVVTMLCFVALTHVAASTGPGDPHMHELPSGLAFAYAVAAMSGLDDRRVRLPLVAVAVASALFVAYVLRRTVRMHTPCDARIEIDGWSWFPDAPTARALEDGKRLVTRHTNPGDAILVLPSASVLQAMTGRRGLRRLPLWWHHRNSFDSGLAQVLGQELIVQCPRLVLLRKDERSFHSLDEFLRLAPDFAARLRVSYRELDAEESGPSFSAWVPVGCSPR